MSLLIWVKVVWRELLHWNSTRVVIELKQLFLDHYWWKGTKAIVGVIEMEGIVFLKKNESPAFL